MAQVSKSNKNKQNKQSNKKNLQEKNVALRKKQATGQRKKRNNCGKWLAASFLVIALIIGAIYYDTEVNGKGTFAKSAAGKMLQRAGVLHHVQTVWYTIMGGAARGYKWVEINVPPRAKPYIQLIGNVTKIGRNSCYNMYIIIKNWVNAQLPVAANFLDQYVPGLSNIIKKWTNIVCETYTNSSNVMMGFFKNKVLVGRFSPDNLTKTLNDTHNLAAAFYDNFHRKVDAYAKLK